MPGPWLSVGPHVKRPVIESISAPGGAPGSKLYLSVWGGRSVSVARAVKISKLPSSRVLLPINDSVGGVLDSLTVTAMVSDALAGGDQLSVTRIVMEKVPGPWSSEGSQENTPLAGSMLAPAGKPGSRL